MLDSDLKFAKERFERIESFEEAICGNTKTRKIQHLPAVIVISFCLFDLGNIDSYQDKQDFITKDLSIEVLFIFL